MAGSAGFGSKFYRMSGTNSTAVAGVTSIGGPGIEGDAIDVSDMDSADGFRDKVPGLVDAGDVELGLNYTKAEVAALHALWRQTGTYKIVFPDSANWTFAGFLNGIANEAPHDDKITSDATFAISGKPTFATS